MINPVMLGGTFPCRGQAAPQSALGWRVLRESEPVNIPAFLSSFRGEEKASLKKRDTPALDALTRMGIGSKCVITGDVTQIDLQRGQKSGLIESRQILKDVRGIAFTDFLAEDVVRHPLVARIVAAYEKQSETK